MHWNGTYIDGGGGGGGGGGWLKEGSRTLTDWLTLHHLHHLITKYIPVMSDTAPSLDNLSNFSFNYRTDIQGK